MMDCRLEIKSEQNPVLLVVAIVPLESYGNCRDAPSVVQALHGSENEGVMFRLLVLLWKILPFVIY